MQDVFFLLVSKHVFLCSWRICLTLIKGHVFNAPFNYAIFSCPVDELFYNFGNCLQSGVTETYSYPLHALYALARTFLIEQSRNMGSSEVECTTSKHRKSYDRGPENISKPCYYRKLGGGPVDLRISLRCYNSPFARILFVFSSGTS